MNTVVIGIIGICYCLLLHYKLQQAKKNLMVATEKIKQIDDHICNIKYGIDDINML